MCHLSGVLFCIFFVFVFYKLVGVLSTGPTRLVFLIVYYFPLPTRVDKTVVSDNGVTIFVKKFGRPTLTEEREGRVLHEVNIVAKKESIISNETQVIDRYRYKCSCESRKQWCIHLALTIVSQLADSQLT